MNRNIVHTLLAGILLTGGGGLEAQPLDTVGVAIRDFELVRSRSPWLSSANAAGLVVYARPNISTAQMSLHYGRGGLADYYQSARTLQAGAAVESFYRLGGRTVLYGKMSYGNVTSHDMAGSAFIDPTRKPFDIVEDSLANTGKKHLDTYRIAGSVGVDVWRGVALGASADFTAANYAKYKDLRHKNSLMDMKFTAGFTVPAGRHLTLGGNYFYRRNTESVRFSTYGKTDKTYVSLISYAAFMGLTEQFGGSGYTDQNREMPLYDEYNGGALQAELRLGSFSFFNSMLLAHRTGYYGRRSPYTITYSNHHSDICRYEGALMLARPHVLHRLDLMLAVENLENNAETYREVQNEAGSTYYQYYDPIKTANKVWIDGRVAYTGRFGITADQARWTLRAGANFMHRRQTAYRYPYYRRQSIGSVEGFVSGQYNMPAGSGLLGLSLGMTYRNGSGDAFRDGTFAAPSDKQTPPPVMDTWLWRELVYLTAPQFGFNAAVRYSFRAPGTRLFVYVEGQGSWRKANTHDSHLIGRARTELNIAFGCTF